MGCRGKANCRPGQTDHGERGKRPRRAGLLVAARQGPMPAAAWAARTHNQRWRDRAQGRPSYRMVRFADDFVVLVRSTEAQAHEIKEQTAEFMAEQMRLTLSPEKTAITHVDDGFDLLGFRIKRRPWRTAGKHVA